MLRSLVLLRRCRRRFFSSLVSCSTKVCRVCPVRTSSVQPSTTAKVVTFQLCGAINPVFLLCTSVYLYVCYGMLHQIERLTLHSLISQLFPVHKSRDNKRLF